ncbi:hypothetical protein HSBAA_07890 [Vreelandella sulfidaeris]|uniref:Uncharacterized protein n=1 Tax=Vreelandella sulfidaeris TaxID=115553 RepID=A0A455U2S6_9GAMM|nr:hypothetical protein HSBAA_07890 [Halomonas sulfidaeris]
MTRQRLLIAALLVIAIGVFFVSGAHQWFTLDTLKAYQSDFQAAFEQHPWRVAGIFCYLRVHDYPIAAWGNAADSAGRRSIRPWLGLLIISLPAR